MVAWSLMVAHVSCDMHNHQRHFVGVDAVGGSIPPRARRIVVAVRICELQYIVKSILSFKASVRNFLPKGTNRTLILSW